VCVNVCVCVGVCRCVCDGLQRSMDEVAHSSKEVVLEPVVNGRLVRVMLCCCTNLTLLFDVVVILSCHFCSHVARF
jgi:hypothetical protein